MNRLLIICCVFLLVCRGDVRADPAIASTDWELTWSDEFDGTGVDRVKWDFDAGNGFWVPGVDGKAGFWANGWGNNELEFYTDRNANAYVKDGALHVKAIKEEYHGCHYTSARLRTGGHGETPLFTQAYGRFECRAKLPVGQGYWPAFWLLPQDETYGGWAASGEIDILENKGGHPDTVQGTIHFGGSSPKNIWHGKEYKLPDHGTVADWHVYAVEWDPGRITWSVDSVVYQTRDNWFSRPTGKDEAAWPAPFDKPFYVVINLAVGGNFGGNPDDAAKFPQEMVVDYVRVYKRAGGPPPVKSRGGDGVRQSVVEKPS